jgi:hypothetical protein
VGDGRFIISILEISQTQHPVSLSLFRRQGEICVVILNHLVMLPLKIIEQTSLFINSRQLWIQLQGLGEKFDLFAGNRALSSLVKVVHSFIGMYGKGVQEQES